MSKLIMSLLPCSFPSCHEKASDVDSCAQEDDRNSQRRLVRAIGDDEDDDDDDITKVSTSELKMPCRAHGLTVGGRKQHLIARLVPCLEGAAALMSDGKDANESDDVDAGA